MRDGQIAIILYGKGGVGKSTVAAHVSVCFARSGRRVLLVGCDPKTDTTARLLLGNRPPTVVETIGREGGVDLSDVLVHARDGLDVVETGGAEPGSGCAGRGVSIVCQLLERRSDAVAGYDVVVFDVLGDLVCGGFVAPLRFGFGNNVFIVSSEEQASLYAANNIARAVCRPYYSHVSVGGLVLNLRSADVPLEVLEGFASDVGLEVIAVLRRAPEILDAEAEGTTAVDVAPDSEIARAFAALAARIEERSHDGGRAGLAPMSERRFWEFVRERYRPACRATRRA